MSKETAATRKRKNISDRQSIYRHGGRSFMRDIVRKAMRLLYKRRDQRGDE